MQELIETFEEMRSPIDSKVDVDFAISLMKSMLEKEKVMFCEFADSVLEWHCTEDIYDKLFNTKEK